MKDKAGTINASGIANVLLGAVNEALVDGKSSKKGNNSKNQAKVDVQVKGKPDMSEVEAAKKEVTKPVEVPVKLKLDASEIKELQNLPTAKAKVEFLIDKKAVNDIVAKDLNNVINKAATKMNSKLQGITSKSMASLASLDKFLPNIPELSSSKHRAMMTELKKKGLSDISQNERAQIESAYRLRSYLLDSKKEMSERGKFIPPSESLVAPDASLSLEDYNKALNGLIKTSKNIVIASDLFEQLNKQLETNKRNIPVEQDISSKTMRRLLGMGIKKNDPDYDPNNYAQYLLNQSLNKAGFSDNIDKIVANQTHKIELGVTSNHLDTIFKKSQNEGLSKKDYSELVNRYINKSLAELEKDILSDDQFGEIALGSISDIKKKAETLNDSLKTRRKNKFIGLMSTYLAKGGSGINNEEFYKALLSDISEYDKDIDAEGKQKAIEQAVQKQLTEQKAAESKEEKSAPKKTTRKRTVKKKESITAQTDVEEKDASTSTTATTHANESKSQPTKPKAKKVSKTTTSKSARSKEKETQELLDQLGSLEGELMRAYDEYVDKKEAYKNGKSPFQYANARENYRATYIKMLAAQLPASSFKNITGKDPFSILKAKSLYDHAYNTSRQIFGIKDSLHDLGYTRDAYPEMFDSLDGMARKIITVNNMRYNNRDKSNGDTDEIAQIIKDVENQATQLEDMVRADGHSGFTLKGIPSIQEPSKGNISKPKSQPALENKEEKQIQQSKDVAKAKEKEADTVVAANDKIAKSEKKAAAVAAPRSTPPTPPKYKVVSAPKLAPIKNNDAVNESANAADAINQSADNIIKAKKKASDAVVNNNNKIAESEKKVSAAVTASSTPIVQSNNDKLEAREKQKEEIRARKAAERRQLQLEQEIAARERYSPLPSGKLDSNFRISLPETKIDNITPKNVVYPPTSHKGTLLKNLAMQNTEYEDALKVLENPIQTMSDILNIIKTGARASGTLINALNRGITQHAIDRIISPYSDIYNMGSVDFYPNMEALMADPKEFYNAASNIFDNFTLQDADINVVGHTTITSTSPQKSVLAGKSYNPYQRFNYHDDTLYPKPTLPQILDGLEQIKQVDSDQKRIAVYRAANKAILTLTQKYEERYDDKGELIDDGWHNYLTNEINFEKLSKDAIAVNKKILKNKADLDTEKFKSTDKQDQNKISRLKANIASQEQERKGLMEIAKAYSRDLNNDYIYDTFTTNVAKGTMEERRKLRETKFTNRDKFNAQKDTINEDLSKQIADVENLGQAGTIAAGKLQGIQKSLSTITTPAGLENVQKQITDINEQLDSNKARESALNYVHNLEQGLTGKQNVVIGQKNASDDFTGSIKNGEWTGLLAGLNSRFETNYQSTSADLKRYIADAQMLGDVGKEAASSFSTLQKNLEACYTESGLKQIQNGMKVTQKQLAAAKKQADEQAAAIKNSDIAKQYDNAIDKAKEVKSINAELLGYKKKQSQYSKGSDTYTEIGNRITETAEAAKKANDAFEKLTQNDFVSKNSEALKNAGKNVEDYDKVVREMKQAQADVSGFDEKTIQANNKEAFTEQYTKAIEKVKELKSAMQDLYSFEAKGAKGQISSDDFISGFTDRFKNIKKLKENVDEFKENTYQNNKDDADSVLNQLLFSNYEKAFTDSEQSMSDYENKITTLMTQAYSRQRKLSNDLYKMAGNKNYSEQEYIEKMNQRNGVQATYEALKTQIKNSGKNIDSDSLISDIKKASDLDRNNILGNLKESLSSQINDFENSLKHMQNTMNLPDGIASLKEKLESAFTFENGADNIGNFKNRMQDFYQTFDSLKGSSFIQFANEFGTAFDSLTKAENSSGKVSAYTDKLNGFVESYNDIVTRFHNKEIDTSQAQDEISELASKMQDFQKVAKNYDKTNSKGTYLEGTKGLVQDTKDVETMLTEYANSIGLTSKISSSINETTGQVKMQFADISGNVVTLTGNLEKAGNAMRIISSTASKASTGMSSFGTSIKGMVSGNFKGAIADIASYVSYFQVTMKAIQQAKQGFNDFLNFQKDLTNVSYTMNLSPDQLQNLGTSAIDMAKDLSMSLDNTMDIYKIYANMNTTASEIQQTARPTAILSNLSGVDASTAADQVQGILQQFHMLEDGSTTAADASMHIVDVLDKVSGSVGIDYAKGIKIISDAVQASGQVAYDAGMSYEQLAAITAKVSERTREDGSSIGNALKTNYCLYVQKCA